MNESKLIFPVEYSTLGAEALLQLVKNQYTEAKDECAILLLKRGFNDTYQLEIKSSKFILRVYKHNWRSIDSIETELSLLNYLNQNDVMVSFPLKDKNNSFIQTIHAPEGIRYAVLFSFAEGLVTRKLTMEQAFLLGINTGKIHHLTKNKFFGITAQNYDIVYQFEITLSVLKPVLADYPESFNYLKQLQSEFLNVFNIVDKSQLKSGICHGDLQAENFHILSENKFTFFDFDFFGTGYLAYDIGVFKWYDHKNKTPEIMSAFLKGYKTQTSLTETEIKLIPYFSTLRALFQMTLYCTLNNGKQLPLWPAQQVADFVKKVETWHTANKLKML